MKKIFILVLSLSFFATALNAVDSINSQIVSAINKSDKAATEALIKNAKRADLDDFLHAAINVCNPERSDVVCDKENNKQILEMLIKSGANPNKITPEIKCPVKNCGLWKIFNVSTDLSLIKIFNPSALPTVIPLTDKCVVAITQIESVSAEDKNLSTYLDFWRDNNCNLSVFKMKPSFLSEEKEDISHLSEIGFTKEKLKKKYGEPTAYEHPVQDTEVLTYKKAEKEEVNYTVDGAQGNGKSIYTNEVAAIYTIIRNVVTGIEVKEISSTRAGGETQQNDFESLQKKAAAPAKTGGRGR